MIGTFACKAVIMQPSDIAKDVTYAHSGARSRRVTCVRGNQVSYVVDGLLTLAPLTTQLSDFAAWAERIEHRRAV